MVMRTGRVSVLAVAIVLAIGTGAAQGEKPRRPSNPANDALLKLGPPQRAEQLARAIDQWCIGTAAFPMGLATEGAGAGNAYWSLRCADGSAWAIQIDPRGDANAIDCASFKEAALGKECFKKF